MPLDECSDTLALYRRNGCKIAIIDQIEQNENDAVGEQRITDNVIFFMANGRSAKT